MIDERGSIETIASGNFKAVQLIKSKAGSIRSNHFHRCGGHWLYVLSGKMVYREFDVNPDEVVRHGGVFKLVPPKPFVWRKEFTVSPGERVWTGPQVFHQTEFLEDTVLVSCAITPLDHDSYEDDTVRLGEEELAQIWRC